MKTTPRRLLLVAAAAMAVVVFVVFVQPGNRSSQGDGNSATELTDIDAAIARGEYLAVAANCGTCHTTAGGEFMAGGLQFETPFGTLYSTNITPDPETGIGEWSYRDFRASMRQGVRPNGEHLYPAFPYTSFAKMTDNDIAALFEYMKTVAPIRQESPTNELSFPFNQRSLLAGWKAMYFDDSQFETDESQSDEWNRGAYLVEALTHCSACHTPRNLLGAEDHDQLMAGGEYLDKVRSGDHRPWYAPNITSGNGALGMWPHEDVVAYLKTGRNSFLESFGPMNEVIMNSTRHLSDADVDAMAVYLKSVPAVDLPEEPTPNASIMGRGRTVYNLHCGTCHLPTGLGDPEMAPMLNRGSLVVQAENPASMINAILYAPELSDLPEKWRMPMEEFQYVLDDDEVAAVATYIRNSWDNRAGIVTADQVATQR